MKKIIAWVVAFALIAVIITLLDVDPSWTLLGWYLWDSIKRKNRKG